MSIHIFNQNYQRNILLVANFRVCCCGRIVRTNLKNFITNLNIVRTNLNIFVTNLNILWTNLNFFVTNPVAIYICISAFRACEHWRHLRWQWNFSQLRCWLWWQGRWWQGQWQGRQWRRCKCWQKCKKDTDFDDADLKLSSAAGDKSIWW